ncbi:helix-turn-helix domain-containing protein [Nocardia sp. NPDC052566]|uniref:helix-turn-helix domain-containing protein n=1 Tax=Nocardia sp. NPDC052566 TaxID=3364330 RepID=UPI0037C66BF0
MREMRCAAGFSATALAAVCGWQISKISKIEHGRQDPTEDDIRRWCEHCGAEFAATDLIATLRRLTAARMQWRRMNSARRSRHLDDVESNASLIRCYAPDLIPCLLQTPAYATVALTEDPGTPSRYGDVRAAVAARVNHQQNLRYGVRRFRFLIAEQALYTSVGTDDLMLAQLRRLIDLMSVQRLMLGIIPRTAGLRCSANNFVIFNRRLVRVETITARLSINRPDEIAQYEYMFQLLGDQAVYGMQAQRLIVSAAIVRADQRGHRSTSA